MQAFSHDDKQRIEIVASAGHEALFAAFDGNAVAFGLQDASDGTVRRPLADNLCVESQVVGQRANENVSCQFRR